MNLFEIENDVVIFSPQALMLKPFREIWDNDKSKDKATAVVTLSFIYYMADERSDFIHILDPEYRADEITPFLNLPEGFDVTDKKIIRAIHFYQQMSETTSTRLLHSTRLVLQKISEFLDSINMDERDDRNKHIYDIAKITSSVEKIPKLIKAINEIEKEVIKEKELKASSGSKTMGLFEGGM